MCGRTACTLAPDDIVKACTFRDRNGHCKRPSWRDPPGGQKYWTSYNIAPTAHTPVLVSGKHFDSSTKEDSTSDRVVTPMKWGLTPSWHQGDPYKIQYETNNCRSEGMLEKKTYKVPLQKGQRCVILADGYFEWKTTKEGKQPYFFYFPQPSSVHYPESLVKTENLEAKSEVKEERDNIVAEYQIDQTTMKEVSGHITVKKEPSDEYPHQIKAENTETKNKWEFGEIQDRNDGTVGQKIGFADGEDVPEWRGQRLLTMAGVFDVWKPPDGSPPLYSYSIITVAASSTVDWCHHRMPAILATEDEIEDWLNFAEIPLQKASSLIKSQKCLAFHSVSKAVNNSRYKSPDCVKMIELGKLEVSASSDMMMNWLKTGSPAKKRKME